MPRKAHSTSAQITEADLRNWKLLAQFQRRLEPILTRPGAVAAAVSQRHLSLGSYLSSVLFLLLNPALKTARALCAASRFRRVQEEVCGGSISLTSFSEMQHLCDPDLLAGLLRDLAAEALPVFGGPRLRASEELCKSQQRLGQG